MFSLSHSTASMECCINSKIWKKSETVREISETHFVYALYCAIFKGLSLAHQFMWSIFFYSRHSAYTYTIVLPNHFPHVKNYQRVTIHIYAWVGLVRFIAIQKNLFQITGNVSLRWFGFMALANTHCVSLVILNFGFGLNVKCKSWQ